MTVHSFLACPLPPLHKLPPSLSLAVKSIRRAWRLLVENSVKMRHLNVSQSLFVCLVCLPSFSLSLPSSFPPVHSLFPGRVGARGLGGMSVSCGVVSVDRNNICNTNKSLGLPTRLKCSRESDAQR